MSLFSGFEGCGCHCLEPELLPDEKYPVWLYQAPDLEDVWLAVCYDPYLVTQSAPKAGPDGAKAAWVEAFQLMVECNGKGWRGDPAPESHRDRPVDALLAYLP